MSVKKKKPLPKGITKEMIGILRQAVFHQAKRWDCESMIESCMNKEIHSENDIKNLAVGCHNAEDALTGSDREFIKLLKQWRDE